MTFGKWVIGLFMVNFIIGLFTTFSFSNFDNGISWQYIGLFSFYLNCILGSMLFLSFPAYAMYMSTTLHLEKNPDGHLANFLKRLRRSQSLPRSHQTNV